MFHNISNPEWFGNWSRLEDDYLGNGGTDIADNFTFSKMEKTGGLFGSIIRLATAFPACDPATGHATGAWKVVCESIDLDEVPLSDIADMISGFDCETITDFRLFNTGAFDETPWQQAIGAVSYTHLAKFISGPFNELFGTTEPYGVVKDFYQAGVIPVAHAILGLFMLMQLIKISQRIDATSTLPAVKDIVCLLYTSRCV